MPLVVSEKVNQVNLNKLSKAQLINLVSNIFEELVFIDSCIESADEDYQRTNFDFYRNRGEGLKAARKYIGETISETLRGVNCGKF